MKLIGIAHWDIEGPNRLEHILSRHSPRVITIEAPKFSTIKELETRILQNRVILKKFIEQSNLPTNFKQVYQEIMGTERYESIIPILYSSTTSSEIYCVDHPNMKEHYLTKLNIESFNSEMFNENMKHISCDKLRQAYIKNTDTSYYSTQFVYQLIENMHPQLNALLLKESEKNIFKEDFIEEREQFMAESILEINPDIHIGGMAHIFECYSGIFSIKPLLERLGDKVSDRIRLCEAYLK